MLGTGPICREAVWCSGLWAGSSMNRSNDAGALGRKDVRDTQDASAMEVVFKQ